MTQLLTISAIILLFVTAAFQTAYVLLYRRQAHRYHKADESKFKPKTAIILCLRGVDPGLGACLSGIANQTYDNFDLHIAVDDESDPSRPVVTNFMENQADHGFRVHLHTLDKIEARGSLKCQSLVHIINGLSADTEVVALIDADAIIDRQWCARLVCPLADSNVGATTGIRWFTPQDDQLGSWVREIWNAAAIVQMQLYQIAWGGSLAIKMSVFRETNLLARWQTALCEDTILSSELQQCGLKIHRVGGVVVNNGESTSLPSAVGWITRQLLTVRLYHPFWLGVLGHAIAVGLCVGAIPALVLGLAVVGRIQSALAVLTAWLLYQLVNALLLETIRVPNRKILAAGDSQATIRRAKYVWALLATQMIQPFAACKALLARTVRWRGVGYRIESDSSVSVTDYRPYHEMQGAADESIL